MGHEYPVYRGRRYVALLGSFKGRAFNEFSNTYNTISSIISFSLETVNTSSR